MNETFVCAEREHAACHTGPWCVRKSAREICACANQISMELFPECPRVRRGVTGMSIAGALTRVDRSGTNARHAGTSRQRDGFAAVHQFNDSHPQSISDSCPQDQTGGREEGRNLFLLVRSLGRSDSRDARQFGSGEQDCATSVQFEREHRNFLPSSHPPVFSFDRNAA